MRPRRLPGRERLGCVLSASAVHICPSTYIKCPICAPDTVGLIVVSTSALKILRAFRSFSNLSLSRCTNLWACVEAKVMGTTYWAGEGKTELPAVFQAFLQCAERRIRCCGLLARTRKAGCGRQQISKSARGTRDKLPLMPSRRKGTTTVRTFLLWRPLPCVGYGTNRQPFRKKRENQGKQMKAKSTSTVNTMLRKR